MCGLVGFVDQTNSTGPATLVAMRDRLEHRGPDDAGHQVFSRNGAAVGLAHRRLSILDLSAAGHQPMTSGGWTIVFNGEVYNYRELASRYADSREPYRSTSDTEVVLRAIARDGVAAVPSFIGMFAFVAYHHESGQLLLGRDRTGIKPLYWYEDDGLLLFGSEPKAFFPHPRFKAAIDPDALVEYLQWGYLPGELSIYRGVHKIPPGSVRTWSLASRTVQEQRYWSLDRDVLQRADEQVRRHPSSGYDDARAEMESLLRESFGLRMVSDVPVGVFLSGGYDSTAVAAILASEGFTDLKTFTIGFSDNEGNEAPFARAVAAHLGTDHHERTFTLGDALAVVQVLPRVFDEPFADTSAIPTLLLSAFTRDHVTVSLSADAGDETFAGYGRYARSLRLAERTSSVPYWLRRTVGAGVEHLPWAAMAARTGRFDQWQRALRFAGITSAGSAAKTMGVLSRQYQRRAAATLLGPAYRTSRTGTASWELPQFTSGSDLTKLLAADYHAFLMNDVLVKVDRATMAYSLEGRDPLMDHRIFELAGTYPDHWKIGSLGGKHMLKDIVHTLVPRDLVDRPKQGFSPPMARWLRGELRPLLERTTRQEWLHKQGVFDPVLVSRMGDTFLAGKMNNVRQMWIIVAFQLWYDHWINDGAIS